VQDEPGQLEAFREQVVPLAHAGLGEEPG
jgi:hypothetical protein